MYSLFTIHEKREQPLIFNLLKIFVMTLGGDVVYQDGLATDGSSLYSRHFFFVDVSQGWSFEFD